MNLKEQVIALIDASIEDNFLTKVEKNQIKSALNSLAPDKRISDFLRSELFKIARNQINENNYSEILLWTEKVNKLITAANKVEVQQERVYFSPGEECLDAILYQIKNCKTLMQICLFTISDNRITEAIIAAHKRGVDVRIITDNDKMFDKGSDVEQLSRSGIKVRLDVTDKHMHHKFALFDNETTLTGSYNWTRSAERYNHENVLITDSYSVLRNFKKEFQSLWDEFPAANF